MEGSVDVVVDLEEVIGIAFPVSSSALLGGSTPHHYRTSPSPYTCSGGSTRFS